MCNLKTDSGSEQLSMSENVWNFSKRNSQHMTDSRDVKAQNPNLLFCFQLQKKDKIIALRVTKCQNQLRLWQKSHESSTLMKLHISQSLKQRVQDHFILHDFLHWQNVVIWSLLIALICKTQHNKIPLVWGKCRLLREIFWLPVELCVIYNVNSPLYLPVIKGLASTLLNDRFTKDGEDIRVVGRHLIKNVLEVEVDN